MDLQNVLEVLGVFLLSSVKFGIAGVPAAVFAKYSFFKTIAVTMSGGIFGTFVFTYLSEAIIRFFTKLRHRFFPKKKNKTKKIFTRTNRMIVYVKSKFGLIGLSIITPLILSIPLGVFLAVRYYHNKQQIILYMCLSIASWCVILYFFYHSFYTKLSSYFA